MRQREEVNSRDGDRDCRRRQPWGDGYRGQRLGSRWLSAVRITFKGRHAQPGALRRVS